MKDIVTRRMIAIAEYHGLKWIETPLTNTGYLLRKDGVHSATICLRDLQVADVAKPILVRELGKLLGCEVDGSGI